MLLSHLRGRCEVSCFFSRTPRLALSLRVSARVHPRPLECFTRHSRLRLSVRTCMRWVCLCVFLLQWAGAVGPREEPLVPGHALLRQRQVDRLPHHLRRDPHHHRARVRGLPLRGGLEDPARCLLRVRKHQPQHRHQGKSGKFYSCPSLGLYVSTCRTRRTAAKVEAAHGGTLLWRSCGARERCMFCSRVVDCSSNGTRSELL